MTFALSLWSLVCLLFLSGSIQRPATFSVVILMEALETIVQEISSVERQLGRRGFLQVVAFAVVVPGVALDPDDRDFLRRVSATLIPAAALASTGIDVVANLDQLLAQGSAEHRRKVLRFVAWARRVSFFYGGEKVAVRAQGSRFMLVRKMGRVLSSLCLVAFWIDDRALGLIQTSEEAR